MAAKTSSSSSSRCDACGGHVGLWQASFTSECAHTFHLRCVSGAAACPSCAAAWSDAPAAAPAPPPATTFSFASASPLFGQTPPATASSSSSAFTATGAFGPTTTAATPNPFWLAPAPTAAQTSPSPSPSSSSCSVCGVVVGRGQATVTSECAHTFHLRCFSGSVCPVCGARWRDEVTVTTPPSPLDPSSSPATPNPFSSLASTPSLAPPNASSSPPQPSLFSQCTDFTFAPANPSSSPTFGAPSSTSSLFAPPNPSSMPRQYSLFSQSTLPTLSSPSHSSTPPFAATSSSSSFCGGFNFAPGYSPPRPSMFPDPTFGVPHPSSSEFSSTLFKDDEPVEPPAPDGQDAAQETARDAVLVLETHCESTAVARDAAHDSFAVLLHAKAPAAAAQASARAPIDLVTVLDTSGSMLGYKLALLKQAMGFVIDNLSPSDRLSIVTFSNNARRIIRLMRMSDGGKASAKAAMESVVAASLTNIGGGLRVAADVLDCRRERNAVAGIILLSDGHDNQTPWGCGPDGRKIYSDLVPRSLRRSAGNRSSPVHTFGFGTDHDAAAMQAVAEETGGTFSFIENQEAVQDSFAQCIGGPLSVAVQEARVAVECLHPGVLVRAVKSGRYESRVGVGCRSASFDVGEMYADEERRFLVFLDVPVADEDGSGVTRLIKASCAYRDAATGRSVDVGCEDAVVQRPVVVTGAVPSVEVARERFRVEAAEDLTLARAAAERGEHAEAARILDRRQEASAAAGLAGDARCESLVAELRELSASVADRREYEQTGRAFMLAGITAHAQQRASTVLFTGTAAPAPPRSLFAARAPSAFGAATTSGLMTGTTPSFGSVTASGFGASTSGFGASSTPAFGSSLFGASSTPAFGASSTPAFGASLFGVSSSTPALGAAPSCFSFGFATPTMQSMVESSRRTRESAPGTNGSDSNFSFS